jgi:AcrR family transcriptional regulator
MTVNKRMKIEMAAERLFAMNGFRATSIRDIARAANVNSSMISYYFHSKEQLLSGILNRAILALNEVVADLSAGNMGELDKIYCLIDYYTSIILKHGHLVYIFLQEQLVKSCPDSVSLLEEFNARQLSLFSDIINTGIGKGQFRSSLPVSMLFFNILGTLRYIVIEYHTLMLSRARTSRRYIQHTMQDANSYLKSVLTMQLPPNYTENCRFSNCTESCKLIGIGNHAPAQ